jgi:hypothetical protein
MPTAIERGGQTGIVGGKSHESPPPQAVFSCIFEASVRSGITVNAESLDHVQIANACRRGQSRNATSASASFR